MSKCASKRRTITPGLVVNGRLLPKVLAADAEMIQESGSKEHLILMFSAVKIPANRASSQPVLHTIVNYDKPDKRLRYINWYVKHIHVITPQQ